MYYLYADDTTVSFFGDSIDEAFAALNCPRRVLAQRPKPEEALKKPPRNREYVWYNQKKSRVAGAGAAKDLWVTYMIG